MNSLRLCLINLVLLLFGIACSIPGDDTSLARDANHLTNDSSAKGPLSPLLRRGYVNNVNANFLPNQSERIIIDLKEEDEDCTIRQCERPRDNNIVRLVGDGAHPRENIQQRRQRRLNPSKGQNLRVLVLLIMFPNHVDRDLPSRDYFDFLFNGNFSTAPTTTTMTPSDINPVGSVRDYLFYNSLGQYDVSFDVRDWQMADEDEATYAAGVSGQVGEDLQQMFFPILDRMEANNEIDWLGQNYVDLAKIDAYLYHLVIVHSGVGAEVGGSLDCIEPNKDRIWSQGRSASNNGWTSRDFFQTNGWAIAPAFDAYQCDNDNNLILYPAKMGVVTHEFMHGFGLPDLYDQDKDEVKPGYGVGRFDIMSTSAGWTKDGAIPGHLSAYSRYAIGWVEPIEIVEDGVYAIQPAEISGQVYRISMGYPDGEFFLIENRQPIKWDRNWPNGGIVISHVDLAAPLQTARGYPGKTTFPRDHYMVSIVQADAQYDMERGENAGEGSDLWTLGMRLGPGTDGTWPNTDSYQNGEQVATGITITILTESKLIMSFRVDGMGQSPINTARNKKTSNNSTNSTITSPIPFGRSTTGSAVVWIASLLVGVGLMAGLFAALMI